MPRCVLNGLARNESLLLLLHRESIGQILLHIFSVNQPVGLREPSEVSTVLLFNSWCLTEARILFEIHQLASHSLQLIRRREHLKVFYFRCRWFDIKSHVLLVIPLLGRGLLDELARALLIQNLPSAHFMLELSLLPHILSYVFIVPSMVLLR